MLCADLEINMRGSVCDGQFGVRPEWALASLFFIMIHLQTTETFRNLLNALCSRTLHTAVSGCHGSDPSCSVQLCSAAAGLGCVCVCVSRVDDASEAAALTAR